MHFKSIVITYGKWPLTDPPPRIWNFAYVLSFFFESFPYKPYMLVCTGTAVQKDFSQNRLSWTVMDCHGLDLVYIDQFQTFSLMVKLSQWINLYSLVKQSLRVKLLFPVAKQPWQNWEILQMIWKGSNEK